MNLLFKLRYLLPKSGIKKVYFLFLGVVVSGVVEAFGIGIVMPFISVVNDPKVLHKYPMAINILGRVGITGNDSIVITLAVSILFLMCVKNLYLFYFMKFQYRFIHSNIAKFSVSLLEKYLHADYLYHLQTNTSELIRNMKSQGPRIFQSVLGPIITLASEVLLMIFVLGLLLVVDPISTLLGVFILGSVACIFYKGIKEKNKYYGELVVIHEGETYKWINQSLGGIKEVKLLGREEYFKDKCSSHFTKLSHISAYEHLISQAPRLFLETLMVVTLMIVIIVLILQGSSRANILPKLALFCAAAFRLMPATNRILGSVISLKFSIPAIDTIYDNIKELKSKYFSQGISHSNGNFEFTDGIYFRNVSFRYPTVKDNALKKISFKISRNVSVGIMGPSGSGKTTMVNLLLGLLKPTEGDILIDGIDISTNIHAWQKMIGFVPQDIYLTDDSITRNIAYGLEDKDIEESKVWNALELAQLDTFIKRLPDGVDTFVGERGMRISGGQRQRIGIARALYHNPEILVFDEATSSLDMKTEKEITKSIENLALKKTIIIVAHRLATLEKCDIIYKLESGRIIQENFNDYVFSS